MQNKNYATNYRDIIAQNAVQRANNNPAIVNIGSNIGSVFGQINTALEAKGVKALQEKLNQYGSESELRDAIQKGEFDVQGEYTSLDPLKTKALLQNKLDSYIQEEAKQREKNNVRKEWEIEDKTKEAIKTLKQASYDPSFNGDFNTLLQNNATLLDDLPEAARQKAIAETQNNFESIQNLTGENRAQYTVLSSNLNKTANDIKSQYDAGFEVLASKYNINPNLLNLSDEDFKTKLENFKGIVNEDGEPIIERKDLAKVKNLYKKFTGKKGDISNRDMFTLLSTLEENSTSFWKGTSNLEDAVKKAYKTMKANSANIAEYERTAAKLRKERDSYLGQLSKADLQATKLARKASIESAKKGKTVVADFSKLSLPSGELNYKGSLLGRVIGNYSPIEEAKQKLLGDFNQKEKDYLKKIKVLEDKLNTVLNKNQKKGKEKASKAKSAYEAAALLKANKY